jgi:decaprenylphospho-beta-D-ribofuranose 2-oxidase
VTCPDSCSTVIPSVPSTRSTMAGFAANVGGGSFPSSRFSIPWTESPEWNRLYGRDGFVQYQFVIPKSVGAAGMGEVLARIVESRRGSFLAVLKLFGAGNDNPLSFPMEGYTLALDFKLDAGLFAFLDELDRVVLDHGGRIYLTKDARMSMETFRRGYPRWEEFVRIRGAWGADLVFHSLQSRRLGL